MVKRIAYYFLPVLIGYLITLLLVLCFGEEGRRITYLKPSNLISSIYTTFLFMLLPVLLYGSIMNYLLGKVSRRKTILFSIILGTGSGIFIGVIESNVIFMVIFVVLGAFVGAVTPILIGLPKMD